MKDQNTHATQTFSIQTEREREINQALFAVYDALTKKGYDPINQIVGYILTEDPTYITNYDNARSIIRRIDCEELLRMMLKAYLAEGKK